MYTLNSLSGWKGLKKFIRRDSLNSPLIYILFSLLLSKSCKVVLTSSYWVCFAAEPFLEVSNNMLVNKYYFEKVWMHAEFMGSRWVESLHNLEINIFHINLNPENRMCFVAKPVLENNRTSYWEHTYYTSWNKRFYFKKMLLNMIDMVCIIIFVKLFWTILSYYLRIYFLS